MRHQFDLNLFAEAPAASTDPAPEAEQMPPEEAQPEQEPEAAKKYTDADVDAIINRKFAKWQAEKEQAVADAQEEAAKLAKMNGEQRRQYEAKKKDLALRTWRRRSRSTRKRPFGRSCPNPPPVS